MSLENLTENIRQKIAMAPQIGAKIKFDIEELGIIFIDGTQHPAVLNHDDTEADTTIKLTAETLGKILEGTQDPTMAFMMGKLKVDGSLGYAMKINSLLED